MQPRKYSHICNLWSKFLHAGMICTTTDTISIPMGEMYLHARMFCTHSVRLIFPWVQCQSLKPVLTSVAKLVLRQLMILSPCTLPHTSSIPMGAINFYMQEHFYTN